MNYAGLFRCNFVCLIEFLWLVVLGLAALSDSISVYIGPSPKEREKDCLVGCFGFNGPLRQYFSLYRAVSQREGEGGEK